MKMLAGSVSHRFQKGESWPAPADKDNVSFVVPEIHVCLRAFQTRALNFISGFTLRKQNSKFYSKSVRANEHPRKSSLWEQRKAGAVPEYRGNCKTSSGWKGRACQVHLAERAYQGDLASHAQRLWWNAQNPVLSQKVTW